MKILLLNVHSPKNAGDLAILRETLKTLHTAFSDCDITVAINDVDLELLPHGPEYVPSIMHWLADIRTDGMWRWHKERVLPYSVLLLFSGILYRALGRRILFGNAAQRTLLNAYYDADTVAVIGGGHLYARHAFNITFFWLWYGLAFAVLLRKPLLMLPQSYGPIHGVVQKKMLRWLVEQSAFVAVRETQSLHLLREIGVPNGDVRLLPDMAFTAAEAEAGAISTTLLESILDSGDIGEPLMGITLMDWGGQNPSFSRQSAYEDAVLALFEHLRTEYQARIVVFSQCFGPTVSQDDRRIARAMAARAESSGIDNIFVVDEKLPPDVLKALYGRMDVMVTTRMHSAIFALSAGTPALVIGYLHKSAGIMQMLGLQEYIRDIDALDPIQLCAAFDHLWAEREAIRQQLARRIPELQQQLQHQLPAHLQQSVSDQ